jgi:uncharacterized protein YndB with AHSA1/START domain
MQVIDGSAFAAPGNTVDAVIHERHVAASPDAVFRALTDAASVSSWLGIPATIELAVGGRFELLFDTEQEPGLQGSEGCQILAFAPDSMLAFTWNSPPSLPDLRERHTFVVIQLRPTDTGTELELVHAGHGHGDRWDENRRYFERAWALVLDALTRHFED